MFRNSVWDPTLKQLHSEIQAVRESIIEKDTKNIHSSHLKGVTFEDEIFARIYEWSRGYHGASEDVLAVEDTRTVTGCIGKQGDCTVNFLSPLDKKIVIEIKAQQKITTPKILEVLAESIQNRSADIAIYVAPSNDFLPREIGSWAQFENKIICTSDVIDVALRYAILNLKVSNVDKEKNLDKEKATQLLAHAQVQLRKFNTLTASARATSKAALKTEEIVEFLRGGS